MTILSRLHFAGVTAALLLSSPLTHASGAVLSYEGASDPTVDVEIAVAVTPFGTTRWTRLTVDQAEHVLWLLPARPGAAIDWTTDTWLTALHDASTPRVAPPTTSPPCGMPTATQRVPPWSPIATKTLPRAVTIHMSENELRRHASARGFAIGDAVGAKVRDAYAGGSAFVAVELSSDGGVRSTPTLRVSDDGPAVVPLALTGSRTSMVRVTAMILGEGSATIPGAQPLEPRWGSAGSTFARDRQTALANGGGSVWLVESTSHDVVFDGVAVPHAEPIEPLSTSYFRDGSGQPPRDCNASARRAASSTGTVGRLCAAGAVARVPGGAACIPTSGSIDPAAFVCATGNDDLALALAGTAPRFTAITRLTGLIEPRQSGLDLPITQTTAQASPVEFAAAYEPCPADVPSGSQTRPPQSSGTAPPAPYSEPPFRYGRTSGGCGGGSTTIIVDDTGDEPAATDDGCGASSPGTEGPTETAGDDDDDDDDDATTSDSCNSNSDLDESSDVDESGDTDDSSDACSGGSNTSSDTASGGDSCDSDDGDSDDDDDDDSDESAWNESRRDRRFAARASGTMPKRWLRSGPKRSSPVSRYALAFVALILPIRRGLRVRKL